MQRASLPLRSRWVLLSLCLALPGFATGCGGSKGKVTGKVTMSNGEPLPGGTIIFAPVGGTGSVVSVWINPDGTYELDAPSGECKISIDNRNVGVTPAAPVGAGGGGNAMAPGASKGATPGVISGPPGKGAPGKGGPPQDKGLDIEKKMNEAGQTKSAGGAVQPGTLKPINPKYYNPETSGLSLGVKSGNQAFDIKLDP